MMNIKERSEAWEWYIHKIVNLYDRHLLIEIMSNDFYDVLNFEVYHETFYHFTVQCKNTDCEIFFDIPIYRTKLMDAYLRLFEAFVNAHFVGKSEERFRCLAI